MNLMLILIIAVIDSLKASELIHESLIANASNSSVTALKIHNYSIANMQHNLHVNPKIIATSMMVVRVTE